MMDRRLLLATLPAALLAGCGFQLRQAPQFAFKTLYFNTTGKSALTDQLRRSIESNGDVKIVDTRERAQADVQLDVLENVREKVVVGLGTTGQVREFQLRIRFRFRLRNLQGDELIPLVEVTQQRDISYSETAALVKEVEESLLYRDMQDEVVLQVMRRLAAVKRA